MKKRSPFAATLLSLFVPFYVLYWFYDTSKQIEAKDVEVPSLTLLLAPFILFVVVMFMMLGGNGTRLEESRMGSMFILFFPAAIVLSLMYYYKFAEAVEKVTHKVLTKGLLFVLFGLISPAAVFLIQDKLNQLGTAKKPSTKS